jgi:hypothetical protein
MSLIKIKLLSKAMLIKAKIEPVYLPCLHESFYRITCFIIRLRVDPPEADRLRIEAGHLSTDTNLAEKSGTNCPALLFS